MKQLTFKMTVILAFAMLAAPSVLLAEKVKTALAPVRANPALAVSVMKDGKQNEMDQVLQSLDGQLLASLATSREFEFVERGSDLKVVLVEQAFANSGNVDASDKSAAQQFRIHGAKYMFTVSVDSFIDFADVKKDLDTGTLTITTRRIYLSVMVRRLDTTTMDISIPVSMEATNEQRISSMVRGKENEEFNKKLFVDISREMAKKISDYLTAPAQVLIKRGDQVTINRVPITEFAVGQSLDVYAPSEEVPNPRTGKSMLVDGEKVGEAKITRVAAEFATAVILSGADKIVKDCIVRPQNH